MPYSSVAELEKKHAKRLAKYTPKQKRMFLHVFNSVLKDTEDEGQAFRQAHAAVNNYKDKKKKTIKESQFDNLFNLILEDMYEDDEYAIEDDDEDEEDDNTIDREFNVGDEISLEEIRVGDKVTSSTYGTFWVTSLPGSSIWTSEYKKDIETGMGRGLRYSYVDEIQFNGRGPRYVVDYDRHGEFYIVTKINK